jgi:hypothetical protein
LHAIAPTQEKEKVETAPQEKQRGNRVNK